MNNDCTIIINSCDKYDDTWYPFFKLFSKFWSECPYQVILNTESKEYTFDGLPIKCLKLYKPGAKIPWGKRILDHLKEVKTRYVILFLDDFFLREPVDQNRLQQCIQWMDENPKISVFSFETVVDKNNIPSKKYLGFEKRPQKGEYKFNLQAAIWRTDRLISYVKPHESPWDWEAIGNIRSYSITDEFYSLQSQAERLFDYGFNVDGMGVFRGKWVVPTVKELFEQNDIYIDFLERGIYKKPDPNLSDNQIKYDLKYKILNFAKCYRLRRIKYLSLGPGWRKYFK